MKFYSFAHKDSGLLHHQTFGTDDATDSMLRNNTPADHIPIDGVHDRMNKRWNGSAIEDYQPPAPSSDHVWNPESKRWQLSAAAADKISSSSAARARIQQLEASQHRRVREHVLGKPGALEALQAIDDEIFSLRGQLQ